MLGSQDTERQLIQLPLSSLPIGFRLMFQNLSP
jgi:hypothetical protein